MARLLDRVKAFINPPESAKSQSQSAVIARSVRSFWDEIHASYDSTQRTPENIRHWQWADRYSANTSMSPEVRERIRSQARYEIQENNCYGKGIANTLVGDTIGTGPRLQVFGFSEKDNQAVEAAFMRWARAVFLRDKLATMRLSKMVDGESIARFITNVNVGDPVSLDLQLIEADQLVSPQYRHLYETPTYVDGVHLDRNGLPIAYDILKYHPGSNYFQANFFEYTTYPADQIIHWFKLERPGQRRGISEFAAALPLFAFARRFILATVAAAETAASVTQVVSTDAPIPEEIEEEYMVNTFEKYMDTIPVDRNSATVLPSGWKLAQFAAEHPTTTFPMFKRELIAEVGRVMGMPANIALADSQDSNFSSAKLDHLGYERIVKIEQHGCNTIVLDRILSEWMVEAALVGEIPKRVANKILDLFEEFGKQGLATHVEHSWFWDNMRAADMQDTAQAESIFLQNGTTHRALQYAERGLDLEVEDEKAAKGFGVSKEEYRQWVAVGIFTNGNITDRGPGSTLPVNSPEGSTNESNSESEEETEEAGSENESRQTA